jgi:hypothetical protein
MDGSLYSGGDVQVFRTLHYSQSEDDLLTARLAISPDILTEAAFLRHAAYRSAGYVDDNMNPLNFIDKYDSYVTSKTVVVYKGGVPAATVRACLYDPASNLSGLNTLPAMNMFEEEIKTLMDDARLHDRPARAVEITRMARHPDFAKHNDVILAVMRMIGYLVLHFDADLVFTAIKENHVPFYRRMGLRKITEPRDYPNLNVQTLLMAFFRRQSVTRQRTCLLDAVPLEDDTYHDLMAGELASIGGYGSSAMLDRMFNRNHEPSHARNPEKYTPISKFNPAPELRMAA